MKKLLKNTTLKKVLFILLLIVISIIVYWFYQQKFSNVATPVSESKPTLKSEQITGTIDNVEGDSLIINGKSYPLHPSVNITDVKQSGKDEITYLKKEELKSGDKVEAVFITEHGEQYGIIFIKVL